MFWFAKFTAAIMNSNYEHQKYLWWLNCINLIKHMCLKSYLNTGGFIQFMPVGIL